MRDISLLCSQANLVPRVHWLFGQREGASRDSGIMEFFIPENVILVPRAYDLFCQRWDRRALVSAITGCREIYCACSVLVRGALGMTILTTTEKFEFLSIELWCFYVDRVKAVRDPLNLLQLAENLEF